MTTYTEPTAEQIREAQAAADAAYAEAEQHGASLPDRYNAYRAAYEAVRDEQEKRVVMVQHIDGTVETHPGWAAKQEQRIADVQPLADEMMRRYHNYTAQLTDDEIALMQALCNETAHDDAKDDATGRPW